MLETVREYAARRLEQSGAAVCGEPDVATSEYPHPDAPGGEARAVRDAHARAFVALAERAAPALRGPEQALWAARLEADLHNLRAALDWLLQRGQKAPGAPGGAGQAQDGALRLATALPDFWKWRGASSEGLEWLRRVLALPGAGAPRGVRARALVATGYWSIWFGGDPGAARALLEEAEALALHTGDPMTAAQARLTLGQLASRMASSPGDAAHARTLLEEALRRFRDLGHERWIGEALLALGVHVQWREEDLSRAHTLLLEAQARLGAAGDTHGRISAQAALARLARQQGALQEARRLSEASLDDARAADDRFMETVLQDDLGRLAFEEGDYPAARACFAATLRRLVDLNATYRASWSLRALGAVDCAAGHPQRALRLMGAAGALLRAAQRPRGAQDGHFFAHWEAQARRALGGAAPAVSQAGEALSLPEAIDEALRRSRGPRTPPEPGTDPA